MADRVPRLLLRAEGLAVLAAALVLFFHADYRWWLLLALILAPDLSIAAFLLGPRVGALAYDAVHTYVLPVTLAAIGIALDLRLAVELGLIWLAHVGMDRAVGYGLKYPSGVRDTHLQRV